MHARRVLVFELLLVLGAAGLFMRELYRDPMLYSTRIWPLSILVLMAIVALCLMLSALWAHFAPAGSTGLPAGEPTPERSYPERRYGIMALFTVYIVAIPWLGFLLATILFIPIAGRILDMPMTARHVGAGLAMAIGTYLLFAVAFDVPVPEGLTAPLQRWF